MADQVLRLIVTGDTSRATREMKQFQKTLDLTGQKLTSAGNALTLGVTLPIAAAAAGVTKLAMDAVESENLFSVSMGAMADSARAWSEEVSDSLGLNEYAVRKTVGTFNVMLGSLGLGRDAAYEMAKGLTELSYDMASFYNLSTEEAFEKLQAGISGEIEPLKRLGIVVNETTTKAWALNHGIIKQGETMTEAQKVQARYGAIMEQTSKAQGDLARTMDSPSNKLRILKEQGTELAIEFGTMLLPTFESLVDTAKDVVEWLDGLSDEQQQALINAALFAAALGPVVLGLGKAAQAAAALHKAYMILSSAKMASSFAGIATEVKYVTTQMNTLSAATATAGGAAGTMALGYVGAAALAGAAIGTLISKIDAVEESAQHLAETAAAGDMDTKNRPWWAWTGPGSAIYGAQMLGAELGALSVDEDNLARFSDEATEKLREQGIELDENGIITEKGIAQLKARNILYGTSNAKTQEATERQRNLNIQLSTGVQLTEEQITALEELNDARDEAESADIRYERSQLRLIDAEKAYAEAVKEYGAGSREVQDAELDLREARLDLKAATEGVTTANNNLKTSMANVPKPRPEDLQGWVTYYEAIGDAAGAAAARANAANTALHGGRAQGGGGTYNIPVYGVGGIVDTPHLAVVGDAPESIISWDPRYRDRSLSILAETQKALGVGGGSTVIEVNIGGGVSKSDAAYVEQAAYRGTRSALATAARPSM